MDSHEQILFSIEALEKFARSRGDKPLLETALRAGQIARAELKLKDDALDVSRIRETPVASDDSEPAKTEATQDGGADISSKGPKPRS